MIEVRYIIRRIVMSIILIISGLSSIISYKIQTKHGAEIRKATLNTIKVSSSSNTYNVLTKIKRLETYYTQGIFFDTPNTIIESGGLYGQSVLVRMEYPSLNILKKINLQSKYFGEGVAKCGNSIYQLTWNERTILKYSYPELELLQEITMDPTITSGWGLATLSENTLVATDGTHNIYILDCLNDLSVIETIPITYNGSHLNNLNALVLVDGFIYANRYFDDHIYKIDINKKYAIEAYNLRPLVDTEIKGNTLSLQKYMSGDVLNGIAYHPTRKIFILTGKRLGDYYEVDFK